MSFNSYTFFIFFALVLGLHALPLPWTLKKFNLLWASYFFYAAWNPPFVLLLWFSTVVDWYAGKWIDRAEKPGARKAFLFLSLASNLGVLGYFKYGGFLSDNFFTLLRAFGWEGHPARPNILLPVGISFYTFQTLSYALDIYLRRSKPCKSFMDYCLYVTFFPQLVAGPIVRASEFLPQLAGPRKVTRDEFDWGISLFILGLFEKMVLADSLLAPVVESVYDAKGLPDAWAAWAGTFAFRGQIACDFSGYSMCAIGAAKCFGFTLPVNFRCPFASIGFAEIWRRWHISLSTWMRDYLFLPLGGSKKGQFRTFINIMVTMLLGGLWHGASWTFGIWGVLNGFLLIIEHLLRKRFGSWTVWRRAPAVALLWAFCFSTFALTVVFFRARDMDQAWHIVLAMLGWGLSQAEVHLLDATLFKTFAVMACLVSAHWIMRDRELEDVAQRCPWPLRAMILAVMIVLILSTQGDDRAFIYFQF